MLTSLSTTIGAAAAQLPADVVVHGPGDGFVFWPFFLLIPLFWFLVIGFFIFFGRRMWRRNHYWAATQGAESVLRERYARGEIDETEYRQRLEVLRAHPTK
ncbi:SHOCT domain-containing protein [Arthrobacter sp. S2(2024)]|jgi:putative membrane protein|uniref:SHOCT domain-containing protein n=1 Tax=Arthrobacter sp. S2(2024) TaxID=3111911 RepID=UPI002FCA7B59